MNHEKQSLYIASSLFNARDNLLSAYLVDKLEELGYQTHFPQRDGFELAELPQILAQHLSEKEAYIASQCIVYYLDMGQFMSKSNLVLANFDDPLSIDDGVVVEISYANLMNKPVIGFRTDIRTPFGSPNDLFRGVNPFPIFQCETFITCETPAGNYDHVIQKINQLIEAIDQTIQNVDAQKKNLSNNDLTNPMVQKFIKGSELLFDGITDIHSKSGMNEIAKRYKKHEDYLCSIAPRVHQI